MLLEALTTAATGFRLGAEGAASSALVQFIDAFSSGLATGAVNGNAALAATPWLGQVLAAQERGDYLWVADVLEFEIAPLLTAPDQGAPS